MTSNITVKAANPSLILVDPENKRKKKTLSSEEKNALKSELNGILSKYKDYADIIKPVEALPEYNPEPLTANSRTDEEISELAKNKLQEYYGKNINAILTSHEADTAQKNAEKESAVTSGKAQKDYLEEVYAAFRQNAENDALKRGLARSSIALQTVNGIDSKKAEELTAANEATLKRISELDGEIAALEGKMEKALADFDVTYAAKLSVEIDSLTRERDEEITAVLKYNNSQQLAQAEYEIDRRKAEQDLIEGQAGLLQKNQLAEAEYAQTIRDRDKEIFALLSQQLKGIDTAQARAIIADLRGEIGDEVADALLRALGL